MLVGSSGFAFGTPTTQPRLALPDEFRNQIADTVSWVHHRHIFQFGFDASRLLDQMNNLYAVAGAYSYDYRANFIADLYQWQNNTGTLNQGYESYTQGFGPSAFAFHLSRHWSPRRTLRLDGRMTISIQLVVARRVSARHFSWRVNPVASERNNLTLCCYLDTTNETVIGRYFVNGFPSVPKRSVFTIRPDDPSIAHVKLTTLSKFCELALKVASSE
ncbi:MAG: hypothetical protein WA532_10550 [Candidatus Korobacteraceae bacterium]